MALYSLLLFPASADLPVSIINGYETESDANDAGDAAIADAYFDRYLVIPGPLPDTLLNVYQPPMQTGGGGGSGGGGGANPQ